MADTRIIKHTLAIDGEKEYKASLSDAQRQLRVLASESKAAAAAFGNQKNSLDALVSKNNILNKQIAQQKEVVRSLSQAVSDSARMFGEADSKTDGYRIQLNNAEAALAKMTAELEDNSAALYEAAQAEGYTKDEAEKMGGVFRETENGTKSFKDEIKNFTASSIAKIASVTAVVALLKQGFQAVFNTTKEAAAFADSISTLSKQTGRSTEELQKLDYASKFIDFDMKSVATGTKKLGMAMYEARRGTKEYKEIFDRLHISYQEDNGALRDRNEVFYELIDALGLMTDETERGAITQKLMGRSAEDLNTLILEGSDGLKKYATEAEAVGAIVDDKTIASLNRLQDQLDRDSAKMSASAKQFSVQYSEIVRAWSVISDPNFLTICIGNYQRAVQSVAGFFAGVSEKAIDKFNDIEGMANAAGLTTEEFHNRVSRLQTALNVYYGSSGKAVDTTKTLAEAQKLVIEGYDGGTWAIQQQEEALAQYDADIQTAYEKFAALNEEYLAQIDATAKEYLSQIGGAFGAFPQQMDVTKEQLFANLQSQIDGMTTWSDNMKSLAGRVPESYLQELKAMGPGAAAEIAALASMTDAELKDYVEGIGTLGELVHDSAVDTLDPLKNEVTTALGEVKDAITAEDENMKTLGNNLGRAIGNGITAETEFVKSAARRAVEEAIKAAEQAAGIASPSKEMRDRVGLNLGRGAGIGFLAGLDETLPSMQDGLTRAIESMSRAANSIYASQNNYSYNSSRALNYSPRLYFSEKYTRRDGARVERDINRILGRAYK
jgi:hypothetical protein